jgi:hypothetical protein
VTAGASGAVTLRRVGLVGAGYYADLTASRSVDRYLRGYEVALRDSIGRLENNTLVDLKLTNTYGPSRHFNSDSVNIFVEMRISLNVRLTDALEGRIRAAVSSLVEESNSMTGLSSSSLMYGLKQQFSEIAHISLVGFNRVGQQFIERVVSADPAQVSKWEAVDYVPEFLNVNTDGRGGVLSKSIEITFS